MPDDFATQGDKTVSGPRNNPGISLMEIASAHISDQHQRLQQEIYVRLRARSDLVNYAIAATAGLAAVVAFVYPKNATEIMETRTGIEQFLIVSLVFYTASFTYLFFHLNFLSHSGYIYAASKQITEIIPKLLAKIEDFAEQLSVECGSNLRFKEAKLFKGVFCWEEYLTNVRGSIKFSDSRFESFAFKTLSLASIVFAIVLLACFLDYLA